MNLAVIIFLFNFVLCGCAGLKGGTQSGPAAAHPPSSTGSAAREHKAKPRHLPLGMVFAKTEFTGVVQTSFIELSFVDENDRRRTYKLVIGDKTKNRPFPWKVQSVQPGYFFVELPAGKYRIDGISIPVGTSRADEPMDISFQVGEGKINYLGTLKVGGTKQTIKMGGVPLIKPGFEYFAQVVDERQEAVREFHRRFPQVTKPLEFNLMQIHSPFAPSEDGPPLP